MMCWLSPKPKVTRLSSSISTSKLTSGLCASAMTTLDKPIVRKTRRNLMHYQHPLVVTLLPGDVLTIREHRCKREIAIDLHGLYIEGLRRAIMAEKREKRKRKK